MQNTAPLSAGEKFCRKINPQKTESEEKGNKTKTSSVWENFICKYKIENLWSQQLSIINLKQKSKEQKKNM